MVIICYNYIMSFEKDPHQNQEFASETSGVKYSVDERGDVVMTITPQDIYMNSTVVKVPNPSPDLVEHVLSQRSAAYSRRQSAAEADHVLQQATDRAWLSDNGIDPASLE